MQNIIESMKGVEVVLSTQIDQNGEFLTVPFVERIKEVISQTITEIRKEDEQPILKEDMWKR